MRKQAASEMRWLTVLNQAIPPAVAAGVGKWQSAFWAHRPAQAVVGAPNASHVDIPAHASEHEVNIIHARVERVEAFATSQTANHELSLLFFRSMLNSKARWDAAQLKSTKEFVQKLGEELWEEWSPSSLLRDGGVDDTTSDEWSERSILSKLPVQVETYFVAEMYAFLFRSHRTEAKAQKDSTLCVPKSLLRYRLYRFLVTFRRVHLAKASDEDFSPEVGSISLKLFNKATATVSGVVQANVPEEVEDYCGEENEAVFALMGMMQ
jgi:hypothetical protein